LGKKCIRGSCIKVPDGPIPAVPILCPEKCPLFKKCDSGKSECDLDVKMLIIVIAIAIVVIIIIITTIAFVSSKRKKRAEENKIMSLNSRKSFVVR
jgi:heme/copper-type cytochrome/quinol oxidase subunit 2